MTDLEGFASDDLGLDEVTDVEFPDGTTVTDPYEDALGHVYVDRSDYLGGDDAHEVTDTSDGTGQASPV